LVYMISWSGLDQYLLSAFPDSWKYIYLIVGVALIFFTSSKVFEWPFKKIMNIKLDFIKERCGRNKEKTD